MAKKGSGANSVFHVILEGIKFDRDTEKRLETEIRRVVMQELASLDLKGDLHISLPDKFPTLFVEEAQRIGGGGHTAGIAAKEV